VPWFVFGFAAIVVLQSFVHIPEHVRAVLLTLDTVLLASAMFALGLATRWSDFKQAGPRPLMLGGLLFVMLMAGGWA
jgi:uncharacterized membrane protein YadS